MKRVCLLLLLTCAFLPLAVHAQVQTGTPPFESFGGGPDVINLGNLNSHIVIPVLQKAGRGMAFNFNLSYDTSIWTPVSSSGTKIWTPATVTNWGWTTSIPRAGYVRYITSTITKKCSTTQFTIQTTYNGWTYYDGFGTPHLFPESSTKVDDECDNSITTTSSTAQSDDGSGYTLSINGISVTSLTASDGASIAVHACDGCTVSPGSGGVTLVDRNGNEITSNSSGYFDTLSSSTPVLTISGSGTPTSPVVYAYTAPSGGLASYTMKYLAYTVATNFGISGIAEDKATSVNLVSEIDLPDGSKYTLSYEPTPSTPSTGACTPLSGTFASNCVTGRLASITLPTGGTISYTYYGFAACTTGNNGIFSDGSASCLQRTTPDGTWTYTRAGSGTQWTTTMGDPQGNQTVLQFQEASQSTNFYETQREMYQGSASSGTLLQTTNTCYNATASSCISTAINLPITKVFVTKALGTEVCEHVYTYNNFGLLAEQDDYDYGSGAPPSSPIRKTIITYAPLGNNINAFQQTVEILEGSSLASNITYNYDETTPFPTNGTPQHGSVSGARGNLTSITYTVGGPTGSTLKRTFSYFDTGNVQTATDVNNAQTTYNYQDATSTCGNAFPTSVSEPLSLSQSMTWNCTGGVETSVTDENGNAVSTAYNDADFWRPAYVTDQEANRTNLSYGLNPTTIESSMEFNANNSTVDILQTLDSLGRVQTSQQREAPGSSNFDSIETDYDNVSRPSRSTVPYVGAASATNGTAYATTQTYDALNRPLLTADGGGGTITLTYAGNDVLQSIGPTPSGENPKSKQLEYNSIGQLTSVCEITSATGSGTCGQTTSATGYWTKYTYDGTSHLLKVTQNAQSSQAQTRTFTYDDVGRMTSEQNPETGTTSISYVYDTDATCGTSTGDLVRKTDAAGNVTCYTYDALHRVTSITYPSGPNSANTPGKFFIYDTAMVNGATMANVKGRLAEAYTCISPCSSKKTDEGFSYTVRGEVSDVYESTPDSGGYFHVTQTYWANGVQDSENNNLFGVPSTTNGVDGEGRPYSVSAGSGQNPVTSTSYNAAGEATLVNLGSGDSDSFQFDTKTFRMTQYKYTVGATPRSVVGNLNWNPNGTLQQLAITDPFNSANTQTCTYSYDDLARLASGNCGSVWSQTFSYDAFGNIKKSGSMQFQPLYSNVTNQMTSIGSFTPSYDSNGDVLNDNSHTYAWDSDTRPTTIDTVTVTYDALGRMVEQGKSGSNTEVVYDCLGNKLALMSGTSTEVESFIPLPAGATAVYGPGGLQYYRHADWLGSSRFSSTPVTRTMYNDLAFAPFGETYSASGSTGVTDISFAGNNEDTTTNLYDAQFREYSIQGRWPSPDPAGLAAANPANPQSWNRYAYALNNPLLFVDPSGLDACYKPDTHGDYQPDPSIRTATECDASGGIWVTSNASVTVNGNPPPPIPTISGPLAGLPAEEAGNNPSSGLGGPGGPQSPSCTPNPASATQYAEAGAEAALLTSEFFSGLGQTNQTFGPNSATSQVMAQSAGVQDVLNSYTMLGQTSGLYTFGVTGLYEAGVNPAAQFVGSFRWSITPASGGINLTLTNTTSFRSLTYDVGPQWQRGSFPTPMGNIHQTFNIFIPCK